MNLLAGLMTKAAGQTWHKSSTPTADHGERAVYGAFHEPVDRADRGPSIRTHVSRQDRGDDLMVVQTREIFELANEAKFEECIHQPVSMAVWMLVQKENVKEMVAEVVEWVLSGTAANDAPSTEVRRDGNAEAEVLV